MTLPQFPEHGCAIPRRDAPGLCMNPLAQKQRAQGMPGAQCARSLACKKQTHELVTTVTPEITRHSPRNGFTAYFALSPVTMLC
jgi:hypothetical protein